MQNLVQNQRHYFNTHATKSLDFRLTQLRKLKQLLRDNEGALCQAIFNDFGKSHYETQLTELNPIYHEIDLVLKQLKKWAKPRRVRNNLMNFPGKSYLVPEPLGVSLVIGAWNFPYHLSLMPVVGSMMAGNTTILKPSELSVQTSAMMEKLLNAHFDDEYLHVIEGGVAKTTELLKQRFDKVFFTGSPAVGKLVNQAVAGNLTNVTLELGGKNPAIVSEKCKLDISVKRLIWGKFINAGQICIAPDYILVHESIKDDFLKTAVAEIEKHSYSADNHNFVQIINARHFERVANLIPPEKCYYGGDIDAENRRISPTILTGVTPDDAVMQAEIFGPVMPVLTYATLDEAFALIRAYEKPLAGYLFSEDRAEKARFLAEIPFGGGAINDCVMHNANPHLPFGGVGNSGLGSYHGKFSFDCFSHQKAVLDKSTLIETNLKYYGYSEAKMKVLRWLK